MVGDIKCGIVDVDALGCHTLFVPHVGDFRGWTLFDVDVGTGGGGEVYGGGGGADVEGDAVVFGEDGDAGGADLVGCVAIGSDAVTADKDGVNPAVLHDG